VIRLVIGGVPRCGTTLAASLLSAQAHTTFVTTYLKSFEALAESFGVQYDDLLDPSQRRAALLKVREEMLRLRHPILLRIDDFRTLGELHRRALEDLATAGDSLVGHKALLNPLRIERLLRSTDARVLILLRDPRDAAVSFWYRTGSSAESYIENWKEMSRYVCERPHPRLFVARFEDLVMNPAVALRAVWRDAGIAFRRPTSLTSMTDMRDRAQPWSANTAHTDVTRVLDPNAIERWRRTRWSPLVRYAGWACAAEMRQLGYAPDPDPFSTAEHRRFGVVRSTHRLATLLTRGSRHLIGALRRRVAPIAHDPGRTSPDDTPSP